MCQTCAKKHIETKEKDECPQCKKSLRTVHFFSGKICDGSIDSLSLNRLFIFNDAKERESDLFCSKHGLGQQGNGINPNQQIPLSDFMDLKKDIKPIELDDFSSTAGPFVIISPDISTNHGCIDWPGGDSGYLNADSDSDDDDHKCIDNIDKPIENIVDISETVIQRNTQMIQKCDAFTLTVNNNNNCYFSFKEWGQASQLKKILIHNIDPTNKQLKEYYLFAQESLLCLKDLPFIRREGIIQTHPELTFTTFNSYEKYMNHIISLKKGVWSKYP